MAKKIDPLNRKNYGAVSAALTVSDMAAAAKFYTQAFGFKKQVSMNAPNGNLMHIELGLRGTVLMLGPEAPHIGRKSAKTVGASPASLYLLTENVDKTVAKAVKLGAKLMGPVTDM